MFHVPAQHDRRSGNNNQQPGGRRSGDQKPAQPTQSELDRAAAMLQRYGYEVAQWANNCFNPYLVVQDPVHSSGIGPNAGKLVLMGYEPVILRSYDAARKFVNVRS